MSSRWSWRAADRRPAPRGLERRGYRWMLLKGRLREGESASTAAADLNGVMRALEAAYPGSNEAFRVTVVPTGDIATHPMVEDRLRAGAVSLVVLMGLVLLIVCANVAGLLLERASARRREIGLRLALGATPARLVRQLLVESAVLSLLGAAGGVGPRLGASPGARRDSGAAAGARRARSVVERPGVGLVGGGGPGGRRRGWPDAGVDRHAVGGTGRVGGRRGGLVDRGPAVEPGAGAGVDPDRRQPRAPGHGRAAGAEPGRRRPGRSRFFRGSGRRGHRRARPRRLRR